MSLIPNHLGLIITNEREQKRGVDEEEEGQLIESSPVVKPVVSNKRFKGVSSILKYNLSEKLGDGTFGIVFLATDSDGRKV